MPFLSQGSSSSGSIPDTNDLPRDKVIIDDNDYVALDFEGYAEKPLSEQLEPIAVVGMGKHNFVSTFSTT